MTEHPSSSRLKQCRRLANVLTVTKQMLLDAQNGQWERVAEQELLRREELQESFSYKVTEEDSYLIAEALAALLHLNEELMSYIRVARQSMLDQQIELSQKKIAVNNYLDIGALR